MEWSVVCIPPHHLLLNQYLPNWVLLIICDLRAVGSQPQFGLIKGWSPALICVGRYVGTHRITYQRWVSWGYLSPVTTSDHGQSPNYDPKPRKMGQLASYWVIKYCQLDLDSSYFSAPCQTQINIQMMLLGGTTVPRNNGVVICNYLCYLPM